MRRTRVKICGIRTAEHALAAVEAGADALGFVFYVPSVRYIDPVACADLCRQLPPFATRVGLFVNPEAAYVNSVAQIAGLEVLQFHGQETPEFCEQFGLPWIKAIGMHDTVDLDAEARRYSGAMALLLDSYDPVQHGGTGLSFDWSLAGAASAGAGRSAAVAILAGGLTPANVRDAIATVQPYAVDVSGGVESSRGVKSVEKIRDFINEVNLAGT